MTLESFDLQRAAGYDERIRRMIPGYEVLLRLLHTCLAAELNNDASVLVVGAGTAAEILEIAPAHPGWRVTATDPSPAMAAKGQEKLQKQGTSERVVWHLGDVETLNNPSLFDAATLMLVLHFLPDKNEKLKLLTEISERMKPGSPFFLASYVGDPGAVRTKKLYDLTRAWAVSLGISEQEAAEKLDPARRDMHLVSEERIKNLLREAGFIDVQRVYQGLLIGAWMARTQRE